MYTCNITSYVLHYYTTEEQEEGEGGVLLQRWSHACVRRRSLLSGHSSSERRAAISETRMSFEVFDLPFFRPTTTSRLLIVSMRFANTWLTFSSMDSEMTNRWITVTRVWPMRWMRPMACTSVPGSSRGSMSTMCCALRMFELILRSTIESHSPKILITH